MLGAQILGHYNNGHAKGYIYGETYIIYSEKFVCSVCSCLSGCVIARKPLMKAVQQSKPYICD